MQGIWEFWYQYARARERPFGWICCAVLRERGFRPVMLTMIGRIRLPPMRLRELRPKGSKIRG